MSQPDGYASRLGDPADWGLTPDSFAPLRDELADHLHCLAEEGEMQNSGTGALAGQSGANDSGEDDGGGAEDSGTGAIARDPSHIAARLASPSARRRLTATRIADQVYATLHRWPNKEEWRELKWLLVWFAAIILSDWMAHVFTTLMGHGTGGDRLADARLLTIQGHIAWLMQSAARAGFFSLFVITLWYAWKTGFGVLLARILQLKLIHTVLVIGAYYAVGAYVVDHYDQYLGWIPSSPTLLTGIKLSALLLLVGITLLARWKRWELALPALLMAFFLYPGGPVNYRTVIITEPITIKRDFVDGKIVLRPQTENELIQQRKRVLQSIPGWKDYQQGIEQYDWHNNRHIFSADRFPLIWGNYFSEPEWETRRIYRQVVKWPPEAWTIDESPFGGRSTTPAVFGGAGLGWLAAPIPFLGVVGLVGLLFLMGRRDAVSLTVYSVLTFVAIASTIMPFGVVQEVHRVFWFNWKGVLHSPFPGFDSLFVGSYLDQDWMLVLGLVLSAAIPWLLTALFLRPNLTRQTAPGPEIAA